MAEKKKTIVKKSATKKTIPSKKSAAKKVSKKKELTWKEKALSDLKKYTGNNDLKINNSEDRDDLFIASDGDEEYRVFESEDVARKRAITEVEDMIDDEPELFNRSFLENYIMVRPGDIGIIANEEADSVTENEDLTEDSEGYQERWDEVRKEWFDGLSKNPYRFLVDEQGIYSDASELMKLPWITIDSREAAEAAVNEDGVAHFIATYDHEEMELVDGAVAYRIN